MCAVKYHTVNQALYKLYGELWEIVYDECTPAEISCMTGDECQSKEKYQERLRQLTQVV